MIEPTTGRYDAPQNATPPPPLPSTGDSVSLITATNPAAAAPDTAIKARRGRFTILRRHAQGGLGQVSLARDEKLRRQVALKEIRPDRLGPVARQRFLTEAEITGQLEHPGIVPIYALDEADGQPYYAMRFIQGQTLAEAIAAYHRQPTPVGLRELLKRFGDVCQALAYAHSNGVIHRDLKPGNIMLGEFAETLVLDWGLAKRLVTLPAPLASGEADSVPSAAQAETVDDPVSLSDPEQLTHAGQILGTPAYMAPEQAEGHSEQIGPPADIYALGAILYEILTGRMPYRGNVEEILAQLRRGTFQPPAQVKCDVPRGLEAICLKAMAHAPAERYASATQLARDVDRWLADEPVLAYPEPWTVRLARWGRRHRTLVASAAVLFLTVVLALVVGLLLLTEKQRQILSEQAATLAAEGQARRSTARAEAINDFLLTDLLGQASSEQNDRDKHVTVEELLDKAADRLDRRQRHALTQEPEVEITLRTAIGGTYLSQDALAKAERQLTQAVALAEQSLGPDHPITLSAEHRQALLLDAQGKLPEAEALLHRVWQNRSRILGADHAETLATLTDLASVVQARGRLVEAETLMRQSVGEFQRVLGAEHRQTLQALAAYSALMYSQGKLAEAEKLARQLWETQRRTLGPDHPETVDSLMNLGTYLREEGKAKEAEPLLREAVETGSRVSGREHSQTITALNNLATLLQEQGRWEEAEPLAREVLAVRRRLLGPEHPATLNALNNLAVLLGRQRKLAEAETRLRELVHGLRDSLGPEHAHTLLAMQSLAVILGQQNKLDEAEPLLRELVEVRRRILPAGHYEIGAGLVALGRCLLDKKQPTQAEPYCREGLEVLRKAYPDGHARVAKAMTNLGQALTEMGRSQEAETLLREAVAWNRKMLPPGDAQTAEAESLLGGCLGNLGKYPEAETLLLTSYQTLDKARAASPRLKAQTLDRIIALYDSWGKSEQAKEWRTKRKPSPETK